jgi:hypothetical protein
VHTTQELCEDVKRIAGRFESQALSVHVSSSPAEDSEVSLHDSRHPRMTGAAVLSGRRTKIPRHKGAPLVGRRGTATARQALGGEVGNHNSSPLTPDTQATGVRGTSGLDPCQVPWHDHPASLVRIYNMSHVKSKT